MQTCSCVWATLNTMRDPADRAIAFIDEAHTAAQFRVTDCALCNGSNFNKWEQ